MNNGTIIFANDFKVDSNFTLQQLKALQKKYNIEPIVLNGKFESYKVKIDNFLGRKVIASLFFEHNTVIRVSLYLKNEENSGWASITETQLLAKKADQDAWLQSLFKQKPPYIFSWGRVESVYDQRDQIVQTIIRFNRSTSH